MLRHLRLSMFKSHASLELDFGSGLNFLVGPNGIGKTNVLEAISYLSLGKSAFQSHDRYTAKHSQQQQPHFSVIGQVLDHDGQEVKVQVSQLVGSKKTIKLNEVPFAKISEHVGRFPMVLVAPDDVYLIREGGEERRRFFDTLLCQLSQEYLQALLQYNHLLGQRNALLKQYAETGYYDATLLETYASAMSAPARLLIIKRQELVAALTAPFQSCYRELAADADAPSLAYEPSLELTAWQNDAQWPVPLVAELNAGRCIAGPHRDDFAFLLAGEPLKHYGSQGQQKSFLLALKLSQYALLERQTGRKPWLLLDDVFDKLDAQRIAALLNMVKQGRFRQLFVTDAQPARCQSLCAEMGLDATIIDLTK